MPSVQSVSIRTLRDAIAEMMKIGVEPEIFESIAARGVFKCVRVWAVTPRTAHVLKEGMLAGGGEAALPPEAYGGSGRVDMLLFGALDDYRKMLAYVHGRGDAELRKCTEKIKTVLMNVEGSAAPKPAAWRGRELHWGERTYIMGILNVTPDSFHAASRKPGPAAAIAAAREMIEAGADIIDVGGESTRPGAAPVPEEEERARVIPVITAVRKEYPKAIISIDTYKSGVASAAVEAGADMINDISALGSDENMPRAAAEAGVPVCLMHIQGTPRNMQQNPAYTKDVCGEIIAFLSHRIEFAVEAGIAENNIIIDPGIGFGKTTGHNLEILARLEEFRSLGRPVLVGASRKAFIGKTLGKPDTAERLEGSLAIAALAVAGGADILRVHDVPQSADAVRMADAVVRKKHMPTK